MAAVLNPVNATVTVYLPAPTAGTENTPSELLTVSNDAPALFVTMTVAPGIAPPAESTTVPEIEDVACANAKALDTRVNAIVKHTKAKLRLITGFPPAV
jgi:hypothetical protein